MLNEVLHWQDYIKLLKVQKLLNDFSILSGISLIIMDTKGKRITSPTNPHNRLCMDIIKKNHNGRKNCEICDMYWASIAAKANTHKIYTCKNGLIDFVTPITLDNDVTAYLLGGQIRLIPNSDVINNRGVNKECTKDELDKFDIQVENGELVALPDKWFEIQAKRLNINQKVFLDALAEISVLSQDKLEAAARMLSNLAGTISSLISQNLSTYRMLRSNNQILVEIKDLIISQNTTKNILDDLYKFVPYKKASIQLIDGDSRTLLDCRGFESFNIDNQYLKPISSDNLIKRLIESRSPIILSNTNEDNDWQTQQGTNDVMSWIGAPILYNEKVLGIITLDHDVSGFYDSKYKNIIISFLDKIAPSLWHTVILNDAGSILSHMIIVNEVAKSISEEIELQDILDKIVSVITKHLQCTHCTLFLLENENNKLLLVPKAAEGASKKTMERRFSPGEGLAGKVFNTSETIITPNAHNYPGFTPARELKDKPRSMLVAPIKAGNHTIGVISADQDEYNWFSQKDKQLVDALAQHAGIAIKRSNDIEILKSIGNKILVLNDIDEILKTLVSGAINLINVTSGVIFLISKDGRSYINKYHPPGFNHPEPRMEKKDGLTRTIIDTGKYLSIVNAKTDNRVVAELRAKFHSILGVPIRINNYVIGVFFLDDINYHNFTKAEISLLSTLADQAAIAIQNVELRKILNREHYLLDEVLLNLVIEEQDQEQVLRKIGDGIITLLGDEVSPTINLYSEDNGEFGKVNVYGVLANANILNVPPRLKNGTAWHVIKSKKSLYLDDVNKPPKGCPTIRMKSRNIGIKSFAAIPLKRKNNIVGVLFINSLKRIEFNEKIRSELEIFASQASLAIEISQIRQIVQISNTLNRALDLEFIASGITHEFKHFLQKFYSYTALIKEKSNEPYIRIKARELEDDFRMAYNAIDCFYKIRTRENQIVNFDIIKLIQQIIDSISDKFIEKNIDFELQKQMEIINVSMNPTELQTVIINLLKNSIDAIPEKQKVKKIIVVINKDENILKLDFIDTGIGIGPEIKKHIFTPYVTTKDNGLGLGLFLVKKIVERNHGEIHHLDNKKSGAIFKIKLPIISII